MLKYKVGQDVFDIQVGKGVIVKTDDTIYPYLVRLSNGDVEWYAETDLIAGDLQAENERLKAALQQIKVYVGINPHMQDFATVCDALGGIRQVLFDLGIMVLS